MAAGGLLLSMAKELFQMALQSMEQSKMSPANKV
jgi:hypothetical protein